MKLNEITEGYFSGRPTSQSEIIFVVENYIKIRKGKDLSINIFKGPSSNKLFTIHSYISDQIDKLLHAADESVLWLLNNKQEWYE
jgi:hypothetical protein